MRESTYVKYKGVVDAYFFTEGGWYALRNHVFE